ncbi:MAG: HNH endonuclease signature motif containing protein [Corynebacterium sp.]|uniref:HNH endonuclease n=1 Tax=Corynebacterium sp. TaxID=1720 RepID=UPI0026DEEC62|nr:HNH endonuclease signature motif containing protein [Corynebacterium sp.]MDO5668890.1 HNH endonuclease signature motif containing protein [Corynebacterium sp.]
MLATSTDLSTLDDHTLTASITTANQTLTRSKAAFITSVAEFDFRDLARSHGASNTTAWMVRTQGISPRAAQEYLNVGRKIRAFFYLTEAFLRGDVSYSKVRLLLKYLTLDNEHELVELARLHTVTELESLLAGKPRVGGPKPRPANKLSVTVCPDTGQVKLWGTLDPEVGAEFLAGLKAAELSADKEKEEKPEGPDSSNTRFGVPVATSLFGSFRQLINLARANPTASTTAPGAQVNIIVDTDDTARLPFQPAAEGRDLLRSIINGFLSIQIRGAGGRILHLGRSSRLVGAAQAKALLTRWNHRCATPGCGHTRWLQFHHIVGWASGGTTDLDNLIPLCSTHHAMITSGELTIVPDNIDPALLRFRFPGGESWTSAHHQPPIPDEFMGLNSDSYFAGPVPRGDEHLLNTWEHAHSFDDPVFPESAHVRASDPLDLSTRVEPE